MIKRRTGRVNSSISWNGRKELMVSAHQQLRSLYAESKPALPRNSVLSCGAEHGAWVNCPNHIADRAVQIMSAAQ